MLHLPALSLGAGDPLNRAEGEPLWITHKTKDDLAKLRRELGSFKFDTIYQGLPVPDTGIVFKREWFTNGYDRLPERRSTLFALDTASGTSAYSDYSVIAIMATDGVSHYVVDIIREKLDYPTLKRRPLALYVEHKPVRVYIEQASSGLSLLADLKESTSLPVIGVKPLGTKQDRAEHIAGLWESGRVRLPLNSSWFGEFVSEHLAFPNGKHDDMVDATTIGLMMLRQSTAPQPSSYLYKSSMLTRQPSHPASSNPWALPGVHF